MSAEKVFRSQTCRYVKYYISGILILLFLFKTYAYAEERMGEILKSIEKTDEVPKVKGEAPPVIEEEKIKPPLVEAPSAQKVMIRNFNVEGSTLLSPQEINAAISPYENKDLTFAEIRGVAERLTAKYREKGYLLAYAYLPAQEIREDVVKIKVIEGRLGEIIVTGNKYYGSPFIERHFTSAKKETSPREEELERSIMLLNSYPYLGVKASLKPGKKAGTADLVAQTADKYPLSFSIFYNNFGSKYTSKHRAGLTLGSGNLITDGDELQLTGVTGLDKLDLRNLFYGKAEYIAPLGSDGLKFGVSYANSLSRTGQELEILDIEGSADIVGFYVTYPFIKQRDRGLNVKAGFDYKNIYDYILEQTRSKDRLRVMNFNIVFDNIDRLLGNNVISFNYYKGLRNFLGGAGKHDTEVSRFGADGGFDKYTLDLTRVQKLPGYNYLILRGSGQYSSYKLFTGEEFIIGGVGSVRGFPTTKSGDSGYTISSEIVSSPFFPESFIYGQKVGDLLKLALFVDHGKVRKNEPAPGENRETELTGLGGGIRLYASRAFSFRFDYAVPRIDGKFDTKEYEMYFQAAVSI